VLERLLFTCEMLERVALVALVAPLRAGPFCAVRKALAAAKKTQKQARRIRLPPTATEASHAVLAPGERCALGRRGKICFTFS
jgi:hypothetical protein